MGDLVPFAPVSIEPVDPKKKIKHEPRGYLLVPVRALDALAEFEASIEAWTSNRAKDVSWDAYYRLVAVLELAPRYTD
jgi:hypothetical protein